MKKTILIVGIISSLSLNALYAADSDNVYLGDNFNKRNSSVNDSFVETMAKNRAYSNIGDASVTEVDGKEEFKEALEAGELDQEVDSNKITQEYKHIEIKNVRLNKNDLKDIEGDRLLIGSEVDEREKLMQSIEIKNSKIETDKQLNVGIVSSSDQVSDITSINTIDRSSLQGGKDEDEGDISRLELMEKLEQEHMMGE
ncbi:MAG: hypothetical protein K0U38_00215 [Epsilonproteobacteria bacterium]|nr:hypothetical protein [Campylobacterota bacterium]